MDDGRVYGLSLRSQFIVMKQKSFKRTTIHFAHCVCSVAATHRRDRIQNTGDRIQETECRIHSIRTAHDTSRDFSLVRGVFCWVFVVLGWIFGQDIFYCKKELICCCE